MNQQQGVDPPKGPDPDIHNTLQPDLIQCIPDLIFHSDIRRQPGMVFQLKSVLRKIKFPCLCHFLCALFCPHLIVPLSIQLNSSALSSIGILKIPTTY